MHTALSKWLSTLDLYTEYGDQIRPEGIVNRVLLHTQLRHIIFHFLLSSLYFLLLLSYFPFYSITRIKHTAHDFRDRADQSLPDPTLNFEHHSSRCVITQPDLE